MSDAHGHGHAKPQKHMTHEMIVRETTKATALIALPLLVVWFIFSFHIPFKSAFQSQPASEPTASAAATPDAQAGAALLDPAPYTSTTYGYRIYGPIGWTKSHSEEVGGFYAPDTAYEFVAVEPAQASVESFLEKTKALEGLTVLERMQVTYQGLPGLWIEFTSDHDVHSAHGDLPGHGYMLILIRNGNAYQVQGGIVTDQWDTYKDALKASIQSLAFNQ